MLALSLTFASCAGKNEAKKDADVEIAKAEAAKAEAEADKARAEAKKVEAELEMAKAKGDPQKSEATTAAAQPAQASAPKPAVISDPDGYTNVRKAPSTNAAIVEAIYDGELFYFQRQAGSNWVSVFRAPGGKCIGYMHQSRLRPL